MTYRQIINSKGKVMHYNGSKLCSKAEYEANKTVAEEVPVESQLPKSCIFCGAYAKRERFVNLKTASLCEEHYQEKTPGEIANRISEILK